MIAAWLYLRQRVFGRIPRWLKIGLVAVAACTALLARVRTWHNDAVSTAATNAATATRDSVSKVSQALVDSAARARAFAEAELRVAKRQADVVQARAEQRTRDHAATDALYASLQHLSEPAKADTTVQALAAASLTVRAENDTLKQDIRELVSTGVEERRAADSLHAADTAAIRGLAGVVVTVRDSLAVEAKRPKRTAKGNLALAAAGGLTVEVVKVVFKLFKGKS